MDLSNARTRAHIRIYPPPLYSSVSLLGVRGESTRGCVRGSGGRGRGEPRFDWGASGLLDVLAIIGPGYL